MCIRDSIQGRNYVKSMSDNLALLKNGNRDALTAIYQNMSAYADLLVSHIAKENNILFRMADKSLSDTEQKELLTQFEAIELKRPAGSKMNDYIDRINLLAQEYIFDKII